MRFGFVVFVVLLVVVVQRAPLAHAERITLANGHYEIKASDGVIESLRCDPEGKGNYGNSLSILYRFESVFAAEKTKSSDMEGKKGVVWTGLSAAKVDSIHIKDTHHPDEVLPGKPLGQTFEVPGEFDNLAVHVPTWNSTTSGATIQLLKDGQLIAEQKFERFDDNAKPHLNFDPQPAGKYTVQICNPVGGRVGWWSAEKDVYPGGTALADGKPVESCDRYLEVPYKFDYTKEAEVRIALDGAKLTYSLTIPPVMNDPKASHKQVMTVAWQKDGYDVSSKTTPFKRFYSDAQRFMPAEQLKRCTQSNHALSCHQWFHFDGTGNSDLRVTCPGGGLWWMMAPGDMTIEITPPPTGDEKTGKTYTVEIDLLPREDRFPEEWPAFETSDTALNEDLNLMLYERNFSYPSPCGPTPWVEWSAIARAWIDGQMRDGEKQNVANLVMDETGYVYTWGGEPGWPFPDPKVYDTRHFDANARLILAVWRHLLWTRDTEYLKSQMPRLRLAMEYQLKTLGGQSGLITAISKDVQGRHRGVGNNYWDILPFGHLDAFANAAYYESLKAMADIERMFADLTKTDKDAAGKVTLPGREPAFYESIREKTLKAYTQTFWDDSNGRFIGCVDIDGKKHDYGFTFLNLEAVYYGLASPEQVKKIYDWMEHGKSSTGEADIYSKWIFAPRATTIHNPAWDNDHPDGKEGGAVKPWWHFGWTGTAFGDQCQDGGAIFYTSFFDLMDRTAFLGADDAYKRWNEILNRYREPDRMCGGSPLCKGEVPQRENPGSVGLDIPFPESGMVPCWFLYGVMGIQPTLEGLRIRPALPSSLEHCTVRNVTYRYLPLNIRVTRKDAQIVCKRKGFEFDQTYPLGADGSVTFGKLPGNLGAFPAQ